MVLSCEGATCWNKYQRWAEFAAEAVSITPVFTTLTDIPHFSAKVYGPLAMTDLDKRLSGCCLETNDVVDIRYTTDAKTFHFQPA